MTRPGHRLDHVYWVGGGTGAGKSTIAKRLAAQHGLCLYATDDVMGDHGGRTTPQESPSIAEFIAMDMDERWLNRSPATMLETFHWFQGEGFHLIVEDLVAMPAQPRVVAEGFRLLPRLVAPLLALRHHAVWLLPTPEFRRAALESRGGLWAIAGQTSDPDKALASLLERDRMFTDRLAEETRELGLHAVHVDVTMTEHDLAAEVARLFRLGP